MGVILLLAGVLLESELAFNPNYALEKKLLNLGLNPNA
jgi:hypothetical protein